MSRLTIGTLDIDKDDVLRRIKTVLDSGFLSSGKEIVEFEHKVAQLHQKSFGIFVNSGQSALEVALELAKEHLKKDRPLKVLVPATTYAATLWAIINTGNIPVFCDIDPNTFCIDYTKTPEEYDVALPVDLCGYPAGRPPNKDVFVIEDACEAIGNPKCIYGDIICSSFYVSHIITTGNGGMLCLNNVHLESYARSYIAHGRQYGGDFTKHTGEWVDKFFFDRVGVSYRGDCLHAALGLSQMQKLSNIIDVRKKNANELRRYLKTYKVPVQFPSDEYMNNCVFQFFPFVLEDGVDRTTVLKDLFNSGIDSRVLFPLTTQPAVKELYGDISQNYPVSARINTQGFIVGCHQHMSLQDMHIIASCLIGAIQRET
ncbi:hypothetical protein LCGC14_1221940 [marine sediment metagenome]|uniref:DegT/DnrJ/EryC1/StrS aminotransferase n=1 Tax=marine sediment metagenome TaxID=412755 RepID=A0A0F9LB05_9ZZZZ